MEWLSIAARTPRTTNRFEGLNKEASGSAYFRPAPQIRVGVHRDHRAVYPLVVAGIGQLAFATGERQRIVVDDRVVGSELIGQPFGTENFWACVISPFPIMLGASSGSNQGPRLALHEAVAGRIKALQDADPHNKQPIPVDLITASGSGLDPHTTCCS